jgi:hypothetical protein
MTINVELAQTLYLCPKYWHNFISYMEDKYSSNPEYGYTKDDGFSIEFLNKELEPHGCTFTQENNKYCLDFQSESDYAAFILIYGD